MNAEFNVSYCSDGTYFLKVTSCLKTDVNKAANLYFIRVDTVIGKMILKIMKIFTETCIFDVTDGDHDNKVYQYAIKKSSLIAFAKKEKQFLDNKQPTEAWVKGILWTMKIFKIKTMQNFMLQIIQPDLKLS